MAELTNCPRCDRVFVRTIRDVCESCYKEGENMFETVYTFVRKKENRKASLPEVSEATDVPQRTIIQFIKQGRLRTTQFPNLTYPCESCGKPIESGRICHDCSQQIRSNIDRLEKEEENQREKKDTYYND